MSTTMLTRTMGTRTIIRSISSNNNQDITVKAVEQNYFNRVLNHVTPVFLRDEPLSNSFPPCTTGKRERDFRKYAEVQLRSGFSIMALDGNQVVGSCLSRVLTKNEVFNYNISFAENPNEDPLISNVIRMIVTIHRQLDLFSSLEVDRVLEIGLVSVEPTHTGRGLASRMVRASLELGARKGLRAAKADCTGPASAAACRKSGMGQIYKLAYDEYKINGKIVFKNSPIRGSHLTVMAAKLNEFEPYVLPIQAAS